MSGEAQISNDEQLKVIVPLLDAQGERIGVIEQRLEVIEKRNDVMETAIEKLGQTSEQFAQVTQMIASGIRWLKRGRTLVYGAVGGIASGALFSLGSHLMGHFFK